MKIYFNFSGTFEVPDTSSLTSEPSVVMINGKEVVLGVGASIELQELGVTKLSYVDCEVGDKPLQPELLEVQSYDFEDGWKTFCRFTTDQEEEANRVLDLLKKLRPDSDDYRIERTQVNNFVGAELCIEYRALVRHEEDLVTNLQLTLVGCERITATIPDITESLWDKDVEGESIHTPVGFVKGFNKDAVLAEAYKIIPEKYTVVDVRDLTWKYR